MNKITRTHSLLALLCALGLPACSTAIITASGTDTETTGEASDAGDPTTTGGSTATSGNSNTAGSATAEPTSTDGGTGATTGIETGADTTDSVTDSGTSGTDSTATDTDATDTDTDATDTDATGTDTDTGPDPVICAELDAEACALEPACMAIDGALIDLENKCKHPPAFIECQDAAVCAEVISYACPDGSDQVHEFPNACLPAGFVPCDPVELEQICD
jgi:hypothetical protein